MNTANRALTTAAVLILSFVFGPRVQSGETLLTTAEVGTVPGNLQGTSLQLNPSFPIEIRFGTSVRASGALSESGTPLGGQIVIVSFVSPTGDPHDNTVLTDNFGRFFCDYVPSSVGNWVVKAHYEGNAAHSSSQAEPQSFSVTSPDTYLTANLSAGSIVTGTWLSVAGTLKARSNLDPTAGILGNRLIALTIYDPSGTPVESMTVVTSETGRYAFHQVFLNSDGKWNLRVQFQGDADLNPCSTELMPVTARPSAGYTIIVVGKVQGGTGLDSHNKTGDRAYARFKSRGFTDENILYFRYGVPSDLTIIVDEEPRQEPGTGGTMGIREAIVTWAKSRMNLSNGPLYILFINHGNDEKFYVDPSATNFDDRIITPEELDSWISQLEANLTGDAAEEEIVFIYGACYSGSFIPTLSHAGKKRVVITSADPNEQSFKGPMENDGVRDGEFFVTQLFTALSAGLNLKRGFEAATAATEAYTSNSSGNGGVSPTPYADNAAQHPLLDDNGDDVGSNDALSRFPGNDGALSAKIILGYDYSTAEPTQVTFVSSTKFLPPTEPDPVLEAKVSETDTTPEVWLAIKPPGFDLGKPEFTTSEQRELIVPRLEFDYQPMTGQFRWTNFNKDGFTGFDVPGRYEILYFVKDTKNGGISLLKRSFVYRSLDNTDEPPQTFDLIGPADGSMQNTVLFLDWGDSLDPEAQIVSYTVEISSDPTFVSPEFVIEGINGSGKMIDESVGLGDLTFYHWRVIAVDANGNRRFASQTWSFSTNDTNAWGNYNVLTTIVRNLNNPSTWPPNCSIEVQPYVGTVYNHFYSAMVPLGEYSIDSAAPQFSPEHDDAQVIEESPTTVLQLSDPNKGTVSGVVEHSGTLSPIRGATVSLEVTSGTFTGTTFESFSGNDGSFEISNVFGAVDYEITVEKSFYTPWQDTFALAAGENKSLGTVQIEFNDTDSDGLPDTFEQVIVDADPDDEIDDVGDVLSGDDFDADGASNGAECAAATDPTSDTSFLRIISILEQANGNVTIGWASEVGVYYEVYCTDGFATWTKVGGPIPASSTATTSWTDTGSGPVPPPEEAPKRFYRVQIY